MRGGTNRHHRVGGWRGRLAKPCPLAENLSATHTREFLAKPHGRSCSDRAIDRDAQRPQSDGAQKSSRCLVEGEMLRLQPPNACAPKPKLHLVDQQRSDPLASGCLIDGNVVQEPHSRCALQHAGLTLLDFVNQVSNCGLIVRECNESLRRTFRQPIRKKRATLVRRRASLKNVRMRSDVQILNLRQQGQEKSGFRAAYLANKRIAQVRNSGVRAHSSCLLSLFRGCMAALRSQLRQHDDLTLITASRISCIGSKFALKNLPGAGCARKNPRIMVDQRPSAGLQKTERFQRPAADAATDLILGGSHRTECVSAQPTSAKAASAGLTARPPPAAR